MGAGAGRCRQWRDSEGVPRLDLWWGAGNDAEPQRPSAVSCPTTGPCGPSTPGPVSAAAGCGGSNDSTVAAAALGTEVLWASGENGSDDATAAQTSRDSGEQEDPERGAGDRGGWGPPWVSGRMDLRGLELDRLPLRLVGLDHAARTALCRPRLLFQAPPPPPEVRGGGEDGWRRGACSLCPPARAAAWECRWVRRGCLVCSGSLACP